MTMNHRYSRPYVTLAPDGEANCISSPCPPEIGLLCPGIGGRKKHIDGKKTNKYSNDIHGRDTLSQ